MSRADSRLAAPGDMMTDIRPARWPEDIPALTAMDLSFVTDRIYRVVRGDLSFDLQETPVAPAIRKRYALDLDEREVWGCALIAESEGDVAGFAAAEYAVWNRRVVIHHLYVAPHARGAGVGTQFLAALDDFARSAGARCLWLETQNVNYPAIQFYRRSGFQLCGGDISLYDPRQLEREEIALFFSRPVLF